MPNKQKRCMICAKPSVETICSSCKSKVQGEAASKKIQVETGVRVGQEMEADKTAYNKKK